MYIDLKDTHTHTPSEKAIGAGPLYACYINVIPRGSVYRLLPPLSFGRSICLVRVDERYRFFLSFYY